MPSQVRAYWGTLWVTAAAVEAVGTRALAALRELPSAGHPAIPACRWRRSGTHSARGTWSWKLP